jgi:hypothetical protein
MRIETTSCKIPRDEVLSSPLLTKPRSKQLATRTRGASFFPFMIGLSEGPILDPALTSGLNYFLTLDRHLRPRWKKISTSVFCTRRKSTEPYRVERQHIRPGNDSRIQVALACGSLGSMNLDCWAGVDALTDALRQYARVLLDPMG